MTAEFRLLGDVEARRRRRPVDIGHARQRCVLAVSAGRRQPRGVRRPAAGPGVGGAARRNGPATRCRGTCPGSGRPSRPADEVRITRQPGGYVLVTDPVTVDLHRFRRLVADAEAAEWPRGGRRAPEPRRCGCGGARRSPRWTRRGSTACGTPSPPSGWRPSWTATTWRCAPAGTPRVLTEHRGSRRAPAGRAAGRSAHARAVPLRPAGRRPDGVPDRPRAAGRGARAPTRAPRCSGCTSRSSTATRALRGRRRATGAVATRGSRTTGAAPAAAPPRGFTGRDGRARRAGRAARRGRRAARRGGASRRSPGPAGSARPRWPCTGRTGSPTGSPTGSCT